MTPSHGHEVPAPPARRPLDRARPPRVGTPPPMRLPEVHRFGLGNGLRVLIVEDHDLPVVALELQVRGGAALQGPAEAGLAALTADMLDEGAGARSALELSATVERLGATLTTGATWDTSHVELVVLRRRLEEALDMVADVVLRPGFPADDLQRVREERMTRIVQDADEPGIVATNAFIRVLYGERHPWGWPMLGAAETLARVDVDGVRSFWGRHYRPELATLVVVGAVEAGEAADLLDARFGAWTAPRAPAPSVLPASPDVTAPVVHVLDRPGAPQSEIRVGRVAVSRATRDFFPLTVLNTVLGGSFTSRLNGTLREEKGYTYGAGSGFSMRTAPGPFTVRTAVHTPVTGDALEAIFTEIRRIREEPVPEEELERARRYVALRLPQRFETVGDVAARLSEAALHDLPDDFWSGYVDGVMAVTAEDVRRAARDHLDPGRMVAVVAGDRAAVEAPLRGLGHPLVVTPPPDRRRGPTPPPEDAPVP